MVCWKPYDVSMFANRTSSIAYTVSYPARDSVCGNDPESSISPRGKRFMIAPE